MLNVLVASLALMAAAGQPVAGKVAPLPPPYQGAYQPRGVDEIGIWQRDDEGERALTASNLVIRDEKLNAYVKKILCDTVGA
ncbi:MAG: peptidase M48, partial [Sphingobium sp. 32-64-5]